MIWDSCYVYWHTKFYIQPPMVALFIAQSNIKSLINCYFESVKQTKIIVFLSKTKMHKILKQHFSIDKNWFSSQKLKRNILQISFLVFIPKEVNWKKKFLNKSKYDFISILIVVWMLIYVFLSSLNIKHHI